MLEIGNEADIAICDNCGVNQNRDIGVECENCGGFYCRKICWSWHWCGELTDRNGRMVKEGMVVAYHSHPNHVYVVVETPGSYLKIGVAYGERLGRRLEGKTIIHPRIMTIKE